MQVYKLLLWWLDHLCLRLLTLTDWLVTDQNRTDWAETLPSEDWFGSTGQDPKNKSGIPWTTHLAWLSPRLKSAVLAQLVPPPTTWLGPHPSPSAQFTSHTRERVCRSSTRCPSLFNLLAFSLISLHDWIRKTWPTVERTRS